MSEEKTEARMPVVVDNGPLAHFLDTSKFGQLQRVAHMFAQSELVPEHYRGKVANCAIAIEMANRMGLAPIMFLQNTYIVHGRPGIESKLAIALINSGGMFQGNLDYEREGDSPEDKNYRVRAFAVRKDTGKPAYGPWIDWKMVKAEGWDEDKKTKSGYVQKSKWNTMPGLMFDYRAAMFFARTVCPERLMGMQTVEELRDIGNDEYAPVSERPADLITLKERFRKEEAEQVEATPVKEKPAPVKESPKLEKKKEAPVNVNALREEIVESLARHHDGDVERMNAALSELIEKEFGEPDVTIDQIGMFDAGVLPIIAELVAKHTGEAA